MSKILLINPPSVSGKTTDRRPRCTNNAPGGLLHPPMTLLYLGGVFRKYGFRTKLIDASLEQLDEIKVLDIAKNFQPNLIFILTGLFTFTNDFSILKNLRRFFPGKIIAVGEAATIFAKTFLIDYPELDYCILGEPELPAIQFIEYLDKKRKIPEVVNLAYCQDNKVIINQREVFDDLDKIPFPDRSLIDNFQYRCVPFLSGKFTDLLTSRGCPYNCKFCSAHAFWGKKYRSRSAENILAEVKGCKEKYGLSNFFILDDLFILDKSRLAKLNKGFKDLKIKWAIQTRVDLVDRNSLKAMAQAGCFYIHYGGESGSQRILDYYDKKVTVKQIKSAIYWTKEAGILSCATFIIGNPEETKADIEKTIALANSLDLDYVHFSPLIPQPASPFFEEYKNMGILKHFDFSLYTKPNIIFRSKYLSEEEIRGYLSKAYRITLLSPKFIFRHLKRLIFKRDLLALQQIYRGGLWAIRTFVKN